MNYSVLIVDERQENPILADTILQLENDYDVHTVAGCELCGEIASIIHPDIIIINSADSANKADSVCEKLRRDPFIEDTPMVVVADEDLDSHLHHTWVTSASSVEHITETVICALSYIPGNDTVH